MADGRIYLSLAEVPLDEYSVPDVGDSAPNQKPAPTFQKRAATPKINHFIIPFTRTIKAWSVGRDVVGAKRAIWRATTGKTLTPTRLFGPIAVKQLKKFQKSHGLTADGQLGPATLKKLAPWFDAYAFSLYVGYPPGASRRSRIVAYCLWGYNNRGEIHYWEKRPMDNMNNLQHLPEAEDCSEFATKSQKAGDAPDPNNFDFNGVGNTETMRAHGQLVSLSNALPGDLVHYDNPQHVAVYVGSGRVVSHGSEIGPLLLSATYRNVVQVRRYFNQ